MFNVGAIIEITYEADKYMYCSTYCSKILISILYIKNTNKNDHFYKKNTDQKN